MSDFSGTTSPMADEQPDPKEKPRLYQLIEDINSLLSDNSSVMDEIRRSTDNIGFLPTDEGDQNKESPLLPYYEERLVHIKEHIRDQQDFLLKIRNVLRDQIG